MTEQIDFAIEEQSPTRWQRFWAWITRLDGAMNYDPMAHTAALVSELGAQVTRLETRVIELEGRSQHTT